MARIRNIKPEFFRSRSLSRCSIPARLTFIGMWTECDDCGRGIADSRVLKGSIWPLDDDVTPAALASHLAELERTGHIRLYASAEETYYEVIAFEKHQSAAYRRGVSKYPDPVALSCTILHDEECKIVLEGKGREGIGREAAATPVVTNEQPAAGSPAAAISQFDQAVNAAVEIRKAQTPNIANPNRWESAVRKGIIADHGSRIHELLHQGTTPADAARAALNGTIAPAEHNYRDAVEWGHTVAQGEIGRGDPFDLDEFEHICQDRDPIWTARATEAYHATHKVFA